MVMAIFMIVADFGRSQWYDHKEEFGTGNLGVGQLTYAIPCDCPTGIT